MHPALLFPPKLARALSYAFAVYNSSLPWITKHDLIFRDEIANSILDNLSHDDYALEEKDPETDTKGFMEWLATRIDTDNIPPLDEELYPFLD